LLSGAGFFVSGIFKLTHQDLGWHADNLLIGNLNLDHDHYGELKDPRSLVFTERMVAALEALPGVEAVSIGETPAQSFYGVLLKIEGQPATEPGKGTLCGSGRSSPGFFKVHGIRLLQGRDFRDTDKAGAPNVAIINESLANKFWPGQSPLGKRIGSEDPSNPDWVEIVGVMQDFKCAAGFYNPMESRLMFLRPWGQFNMRFIPFNIRTSGEPEALKESVRKTLGLLAPDIALSNLSTAKETMARLVAYFTFLRRVLLQISALGLLLAAVGIYGVVANLASERTKEIGIRMALGAQASDILWMFLKNGLLLAVTGSAVGLLASYFLLKLLARMLAVVPGTDPWAVGVVALGLVLVAVLASWLPARRTTKISPTIALRSE
jgi:predicted permease